MKTMKRMISLMAGALAVSLFTGGAALAGTASVNGLSVLVRGDEDLGGQLKKFSCTARPGTGRITVNGTPLDEIPYSKIQPDMRESIMFGHMWLANIASARYGRNLNPANYDLDYGMDLTFGQGGGSAGLAFATVTYAAMTDTQIEETVCMTGTIDPAGNAGAIGGVPFKATGAFRKGMIWMIVPRENDLEVDEMPDALRANLHVCQVDTMDEVLFYALGVKGPSGHIFREAMEHYNRGREAYQLERWRAAADAFSAAERLIPSDSAVRYWRQIAARMAESPQRAPRVEQARAALARGDVERAWSIINAAYADAPDNATIRKLRAEIGARRSKLLTGTTMKQVNAAIARGDWRTAEALLAKAAKAYPEEPAFARELEKARGRVLAQPVQAQLRARPGSIALQRSLARIFANYNLPDMAIPLYERLKAAKQMTADDWGYYALALRLRGRTEDAKVAAREGFRVAPANRLVLEQLRGLNLDLIPPRLSVSLSDNATITDSLGVRVEATDNVGVVRWDALVGEKTVAGSKRLGVLVPLDLTQVPAGQTTLLVNAYDNAGNVATRRIPVTVRK